MSENSAISWCDHTFNPWIGCTKVSPGCDNCYAERREDLRLHRVQWGPGQPRRRTKTWGDPVRWNATAGVAMAGWRAGVHFHGSEDGCIAAGNIKPRRPRVFCASLADVFDNEVEVQWRVDLFRLIAATPNLDWLLLTKRIGNAWPMMLEVAKRCGGGERPMENVWLGATVVDQAEADRDIPKLLATPARVRFLSIEPMLRPIDLYAACSKSPNWFAETWRDMPDAAMGARMERYGPEGALDWVIAGGESGPKARPAHPDWFRSLRDQCAAAGVPFHFKQWGEWAPGENVLRESGRVETTWWVDGRWMNGGTESLARVDCHRDDQPDLYRIGKKAAGRVLDGITHDGFPA